MRTKTAVFLMIFFFSVVASAIQTTSPTAPSTAAATTIPPVFEGLPKEQKEQLEAFGWLVSKYIQVTGRAADIGPLWGMATENVLIWRNGESKKLWPKSEDGGKWQEYLKSQNFPEPVEKVSNRALLFFADNELPFFAADISKKSEIEKQAPGLFFTRGFYSVKMIKNAPRSILEPITSGDSDMLEDWKNDPEINKADWKDQPKNRKIDFELVGRIIIMAKAFYRLNFLLENENFAKLNHCLLGNPGQEDAPKCADFFWNYEYGSEKTVFLNALTLAKSKISGWPIVVPSKLTAFLVCPPNFELNERVCKSNKPAAGQRAGELREVCVPGNADCRPADQETAFKNYIKRMLPEWYPDQAKLCRPFWEKK